MNLKEDPKAIEILIVDDYAATRDLLSTMLRQMGYGNVVMAEDGRKALDRIIDHPPDLIIADWNMPVMNGLDLLKAVRSDRRFQNIPFLMLTAEAFRENVTEALKAGVSDYIAKPFTAQTVAEKIEQALAIVNTD